MKNYCKFNLLKKFLIFPLSGSLFLKIFGCSFYSTDEEIKHLERFKKEVYSIEAEVKDLKLRQLDLIKEKARLIKNLNDCQKLRDSLIENYKELK